MSYRDRPHPPLRNTYNPGSNNQVEVKHEVCRRICSNKLVRRRVVHKSLEPALAVTLLAKEGSGTRTRINQTRPSSIFCPLTYSLSSSSAPLLLYIFILYISFSLSLLIMAINRGGHKNSKTLRARKNWSQGGFSVWTQSRRRGLRWGHAIPLKSVGVKNDNKNNNILQIPSQSMESLFTRDDDLSGQDQ